MSFRRWGRRSGGRRNNIATLGQSAGLELAFLRANLSGGDAALAAIYSVTTGVTVISGVVSQWDDARGATGFAPSLAQATAGKRPVWDADRLTMTFDGVDDDLTTATSALFDLAGAYSLVMVGAFLTLVPAQGWSAGITDGAAPTKALRLRSQGSGGIIGAQVVAAFAQSTVATGTTRRLLVGSKNATTLDAFVDVPRTARVTTAAAGTTAAGNLPLTVGAFFTGSLSPAPAVCRAVLCLTRQATVADLAVLSDWATIYHQAVLA